jgi:mRNA interferase MazF
MISSSLEFGDIVLLRFPFSDQVSFKRRPALVINDFNDGDIIVCRITSQIHSTLRDVMVVNWADAGLKLPSVIRVHKIATLDKEMVETVLGRIDKPTGNQVKKVLLSLTD